VDAHAEVATVIVEQHRIADGQDDRRTGLAAGELREITSLRAALLREQARADQLKASIKTARRIGMAVGLLMGQEALSEDAAFVALESEGARTGRKLHDAAEAILRNFPALATTLGAGTPRSGTFSRCRQS
jgi:hypothetical protein